MDYYKGIPRLGVNSTKKRCTRCRKHKDIEHFSRDRARSDGRYSWCKKCKYEHNQSTKPQRTKKQEAWNKKHRSQWRAAYRVRRSNRTALINKLKNVPCSDCRKKFHPFCMDFDHKLGVIKCRDVSQIMAIKDILEEVKKCDVVCSNCHRLRTYKALKKGVYKKRRHDR